MVQVKMKFSVSNGEVTFDTHPMDGNHGLCTAVHKAIVEVMEHNGGEVLKTDLDRTKGHDDRDLYVTNPVHDSVLTGGTYGELTK